MQELLGKTTVFQLVGLPTISGFTERLSKSKIRCLTVYFSCRLSDASGALSHVRDTSQVVTDSELRSKRPNA
jgi:hypothetical protein